MIDDEYAEKVDLSAIKEEFQAVVTAGMRVLVAALETRSASALAAMSKLRWDVMDELSEDTSPYMLEIVHKARDLMPQLGEALMPLYVKFFLRQVRRVICAAFYWEYIPLQRHWNDWCTADASGCGHTQTDID